jgi:hypothetical protein
MRGLFRATVKLVALAGALCSAPLMMWSSGVDDQWNNVNQLSHGTTYTFVARDRNCVLGRIKRIDDSGVTVMRRHLQRMDETHELPHESSEIRIPRPELLRITGIAWIPGFDPGVVFSARSSWLDILSIVGKYNHQHIIVFTKAGEKYEGKLLSASAKAMTLESSGKTVDIGKDEVSTVSNIRAKPLSDSATYVDQEFAWMKIFDPQLWPSMLHESFLSIRLYDTSLPEDSSPIVCANSNP